jgi:neutral ceramidase
VAIAKASADATATPALGYSFAAGTTDGPGENGFKQGDREEETSYLLNGEGKRKTKQRFLGRVATFVFGGARGDFGVSEETRAAHRPKPVLVSFDEPRRARTESGGNLGWVQRDVQVQVFRLGNVLIVSVPAEVTTVAGRRLARAAERAARDAEDQKNTSRGSWSVVVNGLANGYSGYVTTEQEYEEQRYEGASGLYGPNALRLYERVVAELVGELVDDGAEKKKKSSSLVERTLAGAEADPRAYDEFRRNRETRTRDGPQSFVPPFDARWPPWARFGDVLRGPARFGTKDGKKTGKKILRVGARGDDGEARATFLTGRPRRCSAPPPLGTFLVVERLDEGLDPPVWRVVADDDDVSTIVEWEPHGPLFLASRLTLSWRPPNGAEPGTYRLGVSGAARSASSALSLFIRAFRENEKPEDGLEFFRGFSEPFEVRAESE